MKMSIWEKVVTVENVLTRATPLPESGVCEYCSNTAPLYRAVFVFGDEPYVVSTEAKACGICCEHLNDLGVDIPDHPIELVRYELSK